MTWLELLIKLQPTLLAIVGLVWAIVTFLMRRSTPTIEQHRELVSKVESIENRMEFIPTQQQMADFAVLLERNAGNSRVMEERTAGLNRLLDRAEAMVKMLTTHLLETERQ